MAELKKPQDSTPYPRDAKSQPAVPLLSSSESESHVRVLMVFDAGRHHREFAASAVKFIKIAGE